MVHLNIEIHQLQALISLLSRTVGARALTVVILNGEEHSLSALKNSNTEEVVDNATKTLNIADTVDKALSDSLQEFSPREKQITGYLLKGYSHKMIAHELSISINTVRNHISKIYRKMDVHSAQQAMARLTGNDDGQHPIQMLEAS